MDISALKMRLPSIRTWIDTVVHQHKHVARPVTSLGFGRLLRYFELETLSRAFAVVVDSVPKPPLTALGLDQFAAFEQMNADGITYRDTYFVVRALAADESLHFHELVHVVQWQILGPEQFILAYALGLSGGGYASNPFEEVAYALQDRFSRQKEPFSVEPIVRRHLSQTVPALLASAAH